MHDEADGQLQRLAAVVNRPDRAYWSLSVYPGAGEAGGSFQATTRAAVVRVPGAPAADPERARLEAARRARASVRRYCASNGLNRLGTLTYAGAGCHDPVRLRADLGAFFRRLRRSLGGQPLAYVWVPEWHKTGHGLHAHFAVGRLIARSVIEQSWEHGFVHIKQLGDLPVGATAWHQARVAARYLAKYVAKTFAEQGYGRHRYEIAQGFRPAKTRLHGTTADELLTQAVGLFGGVLPAVAWSSAEAEDWQGPPAAWFAWD